jgi:serine/threonine protein kinase
MAKAIDILHSSNPPVIHRNIKFANVLMGYDRVRSTPPAGTMGYLDPFYVTPDNLSTKIDVSSFGILLLEIISGRKAIDVAYLPPSVVDWAIPLIKKGKVCCL